MHLKFPENRATYKKCPQNVVICIWIRTQWMKPFRFSHVSTDQDHDMMMMEPLSSSHVRTDEDGLFPLRQAALQPAEGLCHPHHHWWWVTSIIYICSPVCDGRGGKEVVHRNREESLADSNEPLESILKYSQVFSSILKYSQVFLSIIKYSQVLLSILK